MNACVLDIETTDLSAVGSGIMLCACIRKVATGKTTTLKIEYRETWNPAEEGFLQVEETKLITDVIGELSGYDLVIGQNIENFDLPFIRSRAIARSIPCYLMPFTYDTMKAFGRVKLRTVLNRLGKPSKSQAMMADFLGLEQLKTAIYPREWWMSVWGNAKEREDALNQIVDHCQRDVRANHQIYEVLIAEDAKATIKRWM